MRAGGGMLRAGAGVLGWAPGRTAATTATTYTATATYTTTGRWDLLQELPRVEELRIFFDAAEVRFMDPLLGRHSSARIRTPNADEAFATQFAGWQGSTRKFQVGREAQGSSEKFPTRTGKHPCTSEMLPCSSTLAVYTHFEIAVISQRFSV